MHKSPTAISFVGICITFRISNHRAEWFIQFLNASKAFYFDYPDKKEIPETAMILKYK